jgi:phage-related minor tail protein
MRFQNVIEVTLNYIMQIPALLARAGFALGEMTGLLSKTDLEEQLRKFKEAAGAKELKSLGETVQSLGKDFDKIGQSTGAAFDEATADVQRLENAMAAIATKNPLERAKLEVELAKAYNAERQIGLDLSKQIADAQVELTKSKPKGEIAEISKPDNLRALNELRGIQNQQMIKINNEMITAIANGNAVGVIEERKLKLMREQTDVNLRLNKILEANDAIFLNAGDMIAQGFEDAILSGQKLGEVVRALGRDLVRLVFQQMVTQRLAAGVTGVLQGKGFAGFMAAGGPVSAGSSYVVGEKGPELFVPHASGTIVPNNKMGGGSGSGGGSVTVNYNIAAGVSRAELVPILDQERRRLKAEIPDMVRRGGGYRAAFA